MPKLYIAEDHAETVYEIFDDQPDVSIGRGAANAVQVHDSHASKMHAAIRKIEGHWKVVDLESKNGTRVNGEFRNQHWLTDGDTIAIGDAAMRYAGEGAPDGAPGAAPQAAVAPVVARTPQAPARTPAPAPAAAPAFTPTPAAPARAPGARSRRRADDYDDYDDSEGERLPRRRSSSNATIVVLGGIGALAFLALMFFLMDSGSGLTHNQEVEKKANAYALNMEYDKAIKYARKHGRSDEVHYDRIRDDIAKWEEMLEQEPMRKRNEEARLYFEHEVIRRTHSPVLKPQGSRLDSEAAEVMRQFLLTYGDTSTAALLLHADYEPYKHFRKIMREHAKDTASPRDILKRISLDLQNDLLVKRFGDAVKRLENVRDVQGLMISRDRAQELRRLVDARIANIKEQARRAFDLDMEEAERLMSGGDKRKARRALNNMIDTYGLPSLVNEAKAKLAEM